MEKDFFVIDGKKYSHCWEYWQCSDNLKKHCSVYQSKNGTKCWVYTDNLKVFDWARSKRGFASCKDCPWYRARKV